MKILWITNAIIGAMHKKITGRASNGVWMDALLKDFINAKEHNLIVATTGRVKKTVRYEQDGVTYYLLPGGFPIEYRCNTKSVKQWEIILENEKPDIIQVWGTEFTHGLAVLKAAGNIPSVVYMQGLLDAIARYYDSGIDPKELKRFITIRDILKRDSILKQKAKYQKRAIDEKEILALSGNIISENLWCDAHVKAIIPTVRTHYCPLSINTVFAKYDWKSENARQHSIICNASGYPLKGLHIILRAIALVKRKYPDVKLYIPGEPQVGGYSFISVLKKRGYTKYIEQLIKKLSIKEQIIWLGNLTQEELAKEYSMSHAFVLASSLENHSSSLKEAMMVGVPCIASAVGGIPEYVTHEENGLLYRFEEYELLAEFIHRIFDDSLTAQKLSISGKTTQRERHDNHSIYKRILNIYEEVIKG